MRRSSTHRRLAGAAAVVIVLIASSVVRAIPSPVNHDHTAATVHWKADGSPALPWNEGTANLWNHNHLTADPFDKFQKWKIYEAWDNRTRRTSVGLTGTPNFGPGLIESSSPVRYHSDSSVPAVAANVIESSYDRWEGAALAQFASHKDVTDQFAMEFRRDDNITVNAEIGIVFKDTIAGAYAFWNNAGQIAFVKVPKVGVATDAATKRIRKVGDTSNTSSISIDAPWNYDGTPDRLADLDLEYSDDSGANWNTLAPAGFGDLTLLAGSSNTTTPATDKIATWEMDFETIARHEIGHSIGLDHAGVGIMRADIAQSAAFGHTLHIDDDSALAAAIDYTYSVVPEPTASLSIFAISVLRLLGRRRRSTIGS